MRSVRLQWIFIIVLAALFMTGCIYNNVLEFEPNLSFQGLNHAFQPNGALHVIFVHGMGHHPVREKGVLEYQQKIANVLADCGVRELPKETWPLVAGDIEASTI